MLLFIIYISVPSILAIVFFLPHKLVCPITPLHAISIREQRIDSHDLLCVTNITDWLYRQMALGGRQIETRSYSYSLSSRNFPGTDIYQNSFVFAASIWCCSSALLLMPTTCLFYSQISIRLRCCLHFSLFPSIWASAIVLSRCRSVLFTCPNNFSLSFVMMFWRDDLDKYWGDTIWQSTAQDRVILETTC